MKLKLFLVVLILTSVFCIGSVAYAQTTTSTTEQQLIQVLTQLITLLEQQIAALQAQQGTTATQTTTTCTSNYQQECYNNSVYEYDSCGNRGSLVQTCSSSQTCSNGSCVTNTTTTTTTTTNNTTTTATLTSIAVTSLPNKTAYNVGDYLDITGLQVTGYYSDGTSRVQTIYDNDISGFNSYQTGTQTITISIGGQTTSYTVTVSQSGTTTTTTTTTQNNCTPNWNCNCVNGQALCTDSNNCGIIKNLPSLNCSGTTTSTCTPNWSCNCINGQKSCTDSNNCGVTTGQPTLNCTVSVPTVDIKAGTYGNYSDGPITIANNTPVTLQWTSSGVTSCVASGGWSGNQNTSGTVSTQNLTASTTFTISCASTGGTATDSVTVNPSSAAFVDLKINGSDGPVTVDNNSNETVTWIAANVTNCIASNSYFATYGINSIPDNTFGGNVNNTGSAQTGTMKYSSTNSVMDSITYTLTCQGPSITATGTPDSTGFVQLSNGTWYCPAAVGYACGQKPMAGCGNPAFSLLASACTVSPIYQDRVVVNVSQTPYPPTITMQANGQSLTSSSTLLPAMNVPLSGIPATLNLMWSSSSSTSCTASTLDSGTSSASGWSGSVALSGSQSVSVTIPSGTQYGPTFVLTCTGPGGTASLDVTTSSMFYKQVPAGYKCVCYGASTTCSYARGIFTSASACAGVCGGNCVPFYSYPAP